MGELVSEVLSSTNIVQEKKKGTRPKPKTPFLTFNLFWFRSLHPSPMLMESPDWMESPWDSGLLLVFSFLPFSTAADSSKYFFLSPLGLCQTSEFSLSLQLPH